MNPSDHSLKYRGGNSSDTESEGILTSDNEDAPFDCVKRKLNFHTPEHSDDEAERDNCDTCGDTGPRLYGKSADIHLVGPTVFWKYQHIKEVTPDPRPETDIQDPGLFPKIRRPIFWGPRFPVSSYPLLLYVTTELPNLRQFASGNWIGKGSI